MKCRNIFVALVPLSVFLIPPVVYPQQAYAAESACVALLVKAGYAAKMRIVSGNLKTDWSRSFAIGQTVCQSLNRVGIGHNFTVQIKAIAGRTIDCTPSVKHSACQGSITFEAWGTTLSPKCQMPT